ncbi:hypothetical protein AMS68_002140 [Peltaster fructicola]|uniref:Transcription factor domain-containing protein n=1 Tax=Peltaster fructicola TaxID=286661 RepID=A0A6H0XPI6_9PEZI|nr:hypothetical protein AMS68_002140 [Peltaster fructicola]
MRSFSTGARSFHAFALRDPMHLFARALQAMELDLSSVMACYRCVVLRQSKDINVQFDPKAVRRSRWESFIFEHPVLINMALLIAVRHRLQLSQKEHSPRSQSCILSLEQSQIRRINDALSDSNHCIDDHVLVAVALYAAYEAKHGTRSKSTVHLTGLAEMIKLRKGLATIGRQDRYVEEILVWMITNVLELHHAQHRAVKQVLAESSLACIQPNLSVFKTKADSSES